MVGWVEKAIAESLRGSHLCQDEVVVNGSKKHLLPQFLDRKICRLCRRLLGSKIEIVYHDKYNMACPTVPLDPLRAERILAFLVSEGVVLRPGVHEPRPISLKRLERVHTASYLDTVNQIPTMTSIMGCDVTRDQVDRFLDQHRLQTGGTLMATRLALQHGVAVNLGGGFHHALADQGGGFCIFNDVAVAIAQVRREGFRGRILIVDLDLHDDNGTRALFAADPEVYTFSIHAGDWGPTSVECATAIALGAGVDDATYLEAIRRHLPAVVREFRPRLVVYNAGCDPAHDDLLGDWAITPQAMLERDRLVVGLARSGTRKVPLVIVLGGGYGQESWRYSARFLSALLCRRRGPIEPPTTEEITLKRYRYLSGLFEIGELSGASAENEFGLSEEDLFLPGWGFSKETRLLGLYTRHGVELFLERGGILDRLRDLGFSHPTLDFDLNDPAGQTVRVFSDPARSEVLVELRLARDRRSLPDMELLSIEWLLLQNPRAVFTPARQKLPGQTYPGLGMLKDVVALLTVACEGLHLDGLIFVPSQYHIAAQWHGYLFFLKPEARARFDALSALMRDISLAEATQAIAAGRVVDAETGEVFRWQPEPMIAPISDKLKQRIGTAGWPGETDRTFRFRWRDLHATVSSPSAVETGINRV